MSGRLPVLRAIITRERVESFYRTHVSPYSLAANFFLTVLAVLSESLMFYAVFSSMGVMMSPLFLAGAFSFSVICGFISFLPAGIGSLEAVMALALTLSGISASEAVAGVIATRSFMLVVMYGFGLLAYGFMLGRPSRKQLVPAD